MILLNQNEISPSQLALLDSTSPSVLFAGGLGSGKSTAGIIKALQLKGANGPRPGLIIAQTFGALYSNLIDPLLEMLEGSLPGYLMPKLIGRSSARPRLIFPDGCKVHVRSAEIPKGYDGLTVAWLYGDECRYWTRVAYETAIARVRVRTAPLGQRAFTSTPVMNWMQDEFNSGKPERELITCGTLENAHNLPDNYIDHLRESYSPRMQRAMLDGRFTILEGAVFEQFDPEPQDSPWFVDFEPTKDNLANRKVYLAIDPGFRRSAWVWLTKMGPLDWVAFDEYMPDNISDSACVQVANQRGWPLDEAWCDPAGDATQSVVALDTFAALRHLNRRSPGTRVIRTVRKFRSIAFGIDKLRVLLGGYEKMPIRVRFARRLLAMEHNKPRGIIKDLASLRYPAMRDGRPVTDLPLKDGITDHSTDALRNWSTGMWMTEPSLRRLDPALVKDKHPGYEAA